MHVNTHKTKKSEAYTHAYIHRIHPKNNVKDIVSYFYLMTAYVFVQNEENTNNERKDNAYE